jgi:micrococcal nuclease|tara:strand:+ start:112 stop:483 length:372 start_codon:yes stop_codon:yes gene_type:complete
MYEYKIKSVDHLVDGDTFDCTVDLGFNISHKIRVRMYGINTPESRTRDLEEKARGLASKKRLTELLEQHEGNLILQTNKKGKYGRYLGTIFADQNAGDGQEQTNINRQLIEEGYAVEYFGGKR